MNKQSLIGFGVLTLGLGVVAALTMLPSRQHVASAEPNGPSAKAVLQNAAGEQVGEAKLLQRQGDVEIRVEVNSLPAGFHGFHVHANSDPGNGEGCIPPFTSADGHYKDSDPTHTNHSSHNGDMPVLLVKADGTAEARFKTDRFSVHKVIGRALIIHADPDNYANIPARYSATGPDAATLNTGDAGGRIACGVIQAGAPTD